MLPNNVSHVPTREECAYLAGLIDGEGCFTMYVKKTNGRWYHGLAITITNSDRDLLTWVQDRFGGRVGAEQLPGKGERVNPCYQLQFNSTAVDGLMDSIEPYLVSKSPQCALARQFRATVRPRGTGARMHVTDEIVAERDRIHRAMSALNSKRRPPKFIADISDADRAPELATHCKRGHELTPDNLKGSVRGKSNVTTRKRQCLTCANLRARARTAGLNVDEWLALIDKGNIIRPT